MDMAAVSKENKGVKYVLLAIDVFSRYVFLQPLKSKSNTEVIQAFKNIFKEGRKPKVIRSDKGSEFTGSGVEKFLRRLVFTIL